MGTLGGPTARGTEAETNQLSSTIAIAKTKETFLRDLISSSSEALDEVKKSKPGPSVHHPELSIRLITDKAAKTLTVADSGVGMARSDLSRHLGTIAGTSSKGCLKSDASMVGVWFFPAFLVADKVVVTTKDGQQHQFTWECDSFAVDLDADGERLHRGTKIKMFLKDEHLEYLEKRRLEDLVSTYSAGIAYPIYFSTDKGGGADEWVQINETELSFVRMVQELSSYADASFSGAENPQELFFARRVQELFFARKVQELSAFADASFSGAENPPELPKMMLAFKDWCFSSDRENPPPPYRNMAELFNLVTEGRCYNCLGTGHFVADCRAPTRCLLCFCSGHIARNCALADTPGSPHRRPPWVGACVPFSTAPSPTAAAAAPAPALLLYKVRVCVEGVPAHARRPETVAGLLGGFALVEGLDGGARGPDKEAACVCAWVWTHDPDAVAKAGTLLVQQPRAPTWPASLAVHSDPGLIGCPPCAAGPPQMLAYPVIIHVDRVYDYSAGGGSGGGGGLWPRCHVFSWNLGVLDGVAPPF